MIVRNIASAAIQLILNLVHIISMCMTHSKSIFMKNVGFYAWTAFPLICERIQPLCRFCFVYRVSANRNVFAFFIQHVHIFGQVFVRDVVMTANEALNPVAEHGWSHVCDFHATAIVIKRDLLHV